MTPKGLGGGCAFLSNHRPYWLRKGGVTQRLCATLFRRSGHTHPHTALARTVGRPLLRG